MQLMLKNQLTVANKNLNQNEIPHETHAEVFLHQLFLRVSEKVNKKTLDIFGLSKVHSAKLKFICSIKVERTVC